MTTDAASADSTPSPAPPPAANDPQALRDLIRSAVLGRRPTDARERWSIDEFVRHFDPLAAPFDEHADKVHVTASAIVTSDDGRHVLLHRHKRLQIWLQPGGHIEPAEMPWQGALREAAEETGLPVSLASEQLVHVDVHPGPRRHTHLDLRYAVTAPHVAPAPPEGESAEVEWFPWHRAVAMADAGLEGVLRAMQPGAPKVRAARHNDARDAAQVYTRSRAYALPEVPLVHDEKDVRRWMSDDVVGRTDMWVADLDGTVVGLMVLDAGEAAADGRRAGWIEQLYLDPAWMGRGLGDRFVDVAKSRYPGGLQLWTFVVNERARRFYERHGFVLEETTDGRGNENRSPDHRLHWRP